MELWWHHLSNWGICRSLCTVRDTQSRTWFQQTQLRQQCICRLSWTSASWVRPSLPARESCGYSFPVSFLYRSRGILVSHELGRRLFYHSRRRQWSRWFLLETACVSWPLEVCRTAGYTVRGRRRGLRPFEVFRLLLCLNKNVHIRFTYSWLGYSKLQNWIYRGRGHPSRSQSTRPLDWNRRAAQREGMLVWWASWKSLLFPACNNYETKISRNQRALSSFLAHIFIL